MKAGSQLDLLAALGQARWQIIVNSLRNEKSKRQELAAKIVVIIIGSVATLGFGFGMAALAYGSVSRGRPNGAIAAFWVVGTMWMFIHAMASASPGISFRDIARYPLSFGAFATLQVLSVFAEMTTLAACVWMLSIWIGVTLSKPALSLRTALMAWLFWLVVVQFNRLITEIVERITATKKGRRRLMATMILLSFAYQFVIFSGKEANKGYVLIIPKIRWIGPYLPPELAGRAATGAPLLPAILALVPYIVILLSPLYWIYRRKYEGELLSEAPAQTTTITRDAGWQFPFLDNAMSALLEKEYRYILSQPMGWLSIVYGPVMAVIMSMGGMGRIFGMSSQFTFPTLIGWTLLTMGGRAYNIFGFDWRGIDRYLMSPLSMRQVIWSKNLMILSLLAVNFVGIALVLNWFVPISLKYLATNFVAFCVASFATVGAGNYISVRFPVFIDLETFKSKATSGTAQLAIVGTQFGLLGILGLIFYFKLPALAVFGGLSIPAAFLYWISLTSAAHHAAEHGEDIARVLV